ncbi:hypothetical protein LTS18_010716, partial [Coniosporium uncinatum]
MPVATSASQYVCARCLRARRATTRAASTTLRRIAVANTRSFITHSPRFAASYNDEGGKGEAKGKDGGSERKEQGALSRRLEQMTEESLESSGSSSARKVIEEAGFDESLRLKLEQRIADASFRSQHAGALAAAELPESAGRGTRDIAGAAPWTGTESVEDASLRMLTDSYKPVRGPARIPGIRGPPPRVETGRSK